MYYYTEKDINRLETQAAQIREDIIRMISKAGSGHPGGALSAVEMVTALYFHVMNLRPEDPEWKDRDRFILSKGHACPVLYAALARRGYYSPEHLTTLREYQSILQGHPDMKRTPGIDMTAGSLGNGLSIGVGMAMSAKMNKQDYTTYVLLGDGEIQEGMVWEAAMAAGHHKLDNLVAMVDCNGLQINGWVNNIMGLEPLADKWKAFGWGVIEVWGHDFKELLNAFHRAKVMQRPAVILAHTVKGKGVSFMEDNKDWHGKAPNEKEQKQALEEIGGDR